MTTTCLIGVIDDDPSLRKAIVRLLGAAGYTTRDFSSAEEFLQSSILEEYRCVVTDIQLPNMSGLELIDLIAKRRSLLPIIAITARSEEGLEKKVLSSGAARFFTKPIHPDHLLGAIESTLNQ